MSIGLLSFKSWLSINDRRIHIPPRFVFFFIIVICLFLISFITYGASQFIIVLSLSLHLLSYCMLNTCNYTNPQTPGQPLHMSLALGQPLRSFTTIHPENPPPINFVLSWYHCRVHPDGCLQLCKSLRWPPLFLPKCFAQALGPLICKFFFPRPLYYSCPSNLHVARFTPNTSLPIYIP